MPNIANLTRGQTKVLSPVFIARLAQANNAARQLRQMGCRIVRLVIGSAEQDIEIVIDRNPQRRIGLAGVHVTCELPR